MTFCCVWSLSIWGLLTFLLWLSYVLNRNQTSQYQNIYTYIKYISIKIHRKKWISSLRGHFSHQQQYPWLCPRLTNSPDTRVKSQLSPWDNSPNSLPGKLSSLQRQHDPASVTRSLFPSCFSFKSSLFLLFIYSVLFCPLGPPSLTKQHLLAGGLLWSTHGNLLPLELPSGRPWHLESLSSREMKCWFLS